MKENVKQYISFKKGEVFLPGHLKPQKGLRGRMFKSDFLESLTKTPLWVPQGMYIILIFLFYYYALTYLSFNWIHLLIYGFAGILTWTFVEYIVHRFVYHTETNYDFFYRIQHSGHGIHHNYPRDSRRLAMPPVPSLILSSIFFGLFYLIMGSYASMFMPGFWLGYLLYITLHYYQHVIPIPKFSPLKRLWNFHFIHHGINPYSAFGVSTRLWDYIFRTLPTKKDWETFNK